MSTDNNDVRIIQTAQLPRRNPNAMSMSHVKQDAMDDQGSFQRGRSQSMLISPSEPNDELQRTASISRRKLPSKQLTPLEQFNAEFASHPQAISRMKTFAIYAQTQGEKQVKSLHNKLINLLNIRDKQKQDLQNRDLALSAVDAMADLFVLYVSLYGKTDAKQVKEEMDAIQKQLADLFKVCGYDKRTFFSIEKLLRKLLLETSPTEKKSILDQAAKIKRELGSLKVSLMQKKAQAQESKAKVDQAIIENFIIEVAPEFEKRLKYAQNQEDIEGWEQALLITIAQGKYAAVKEEILNHKEIIRLRRKAQDMAEKPQASSPEGQRIKQQKKERIEELKAIGQHNKKVHLELVSKLRSELEEIKIAHNLKEAKTDEDIVKATVAIDAFLEKISKEALTTANPHTKDELFQIRLEAEGLKMLPIKEELKSLHRKLKLAFGDDVDNIDALLEEIENYLRKVEDHIHSLDDELGSMDTSEKKNDSLIREELIAIQEMAKFLKEKAEAYQAAKAKLAILQPELNEKESLRALNQTVRQKGEMLQVAEAELQAHRSKEGEIKNKGLILVQQLEQNEVAQRLNNSKIIENQTQQHIFKDEESRWARKAAEVSAKTESLTKEIENSKRKIEAQKIEEQQLMEKLAEIDSELATLVKKTAVLREQREQVNESDKAVKAVEAAIKEQKEQQQSFWSDERKHFDRKIEIDEEIDIYSERDLKQKIGVTQAEIEARIGERRLLIGPPYQTIRNHFNVEIDSCIKVIDDFTEKNSIFSGNIFSIFIRPWLWGRAFSGRDKAMTKALAGAKEKLIALKSEEAINGDKFCEIIQPLGREFRTRFNEEINAQNKDNGLLEKLGLRTVHQKIVICQRSYENNLSSLTTALEPIDINIERLQTEKAKLERMLKESPEKIRILCAEREQVAAFRRIADQEAKEKGKAIAKLEKEDLALATTTLHTALEKVKEDLRVAYQERLGVIERKLRAFSADLAALNPKDEHYTEEKNNFEKRICDLKREESEIKSAMDFLGKNEEILASRLTNSQRNIDAHLQLIAEKTERYNNAKKNYEVALQETNVCREKLLKERKPFEEELEKANASKNVVDNEQAILQQKLENIEAEKSKLEAETRRLAEEAHKINEQKEASSCELAAFYAERSRLESKKAAVILEIKALKDNLQQKVQVFMNAERRKNLSTGLNASEEQKTWLNILHDEIAQCEEEIEEKYCILNGVKEALQVPVGPQKPILARSLYSKSSASVISQTPQPQRRMVGTDLRPRAISMMGLSHSRSLNSAESRVMAGIPSFASTPVSQSATPGPDQLAVDLEEDALSLPCAAGLDTGDDVLSPAIPRCSSADNTPKIDASEIQELNRAQKRREIGLQGRASFHFSTPDKATCQSEKLQRRQQSEGSVWTAPTSPALLAENSQKAAAEAKESLKRNEEENLITKHSSWLAKGLSPF